MRDTFTGGVTYFESTRELRFASVEHWYRYEHWFRDKRLKDIEGDVWDYIDGEWGYWDGYATCYDTPIEDYVMDGFTVINYRGPLVTG